MRIIKALFAMIFLSVNLLATAQADDTVTLTSLEWPPYSGQQLLEQGASCAVAKAAFAAMGYRLKIEFYPWSRAVVLAATQANYAGYFPEYDSPSVAKRFILSDPIGTGPLALAQRRDSPISWNTIADLSHWRVGVVQDYVNNTEFDQRVADRLQPIDVAINDTLNLKKLAAGRVDLAIIDPYVFDYLAGQNSQLTSLLEINPKIIENKQIYIAFKRSPDGVRWASIFDAGLKKINVTEIMRQYIKDYH